MTREMLYDAITDVKDELVTEAMETRPAKNRVHWLKFGSIAAAVALVVGLGAGVMNGTIRLPLGGNEAGSGHDESSIFMAYAGPVFPLTTVEGGGGLTAQRAITYDFQDWMLHSYWGLSTTDAYTLTNPTGEDKEVTLLYPFVTTLYRLDRYSPALTLDGVKLDTELLTGQYSRIGSGRSGGLPSMSQTESWTGYQTLLSDGRYQSGALEEWPDLSHIPVTVYEVTDPWVAEDAGGTNPTIHTAFGLDYDKTVVLSYGFNGGCYDRDTGTMRQSFSVPRPSEGGTYMDYGFYERDLAESHYLIVVGEPVSDFQLFGTYDGDPASTDYMEWDRSIRADMRQYETDLESALRTVAEQLHGKRWANASGVADDEYRPDFELYFGMMKDCLLETGVLLGDADGRLDDLSFESNNRVFYLKAQVTVPAGGSVTVEAQMLKEPSYDFCCTGTKNQGVYGYDLVTRLGTRLDFTAQTAKAVNTDGVEIVRQNFGFDWANGADTVTLDPAEEHYYLEVRRSTEK